MMYGSCPASSITWFGVNGWWIAMLVVALLVAVVTAAVVLLAARQRVPDPALDRLRVRLAGGEITPDEFEAARKALGS